ncbi:MAG: sulfotransferase family protein [Gemmatimonadales bacterium]
MAARKPNLFVIGAMKSGTSSLCVHLSEHPAVFMSPVKEPEHFSRPESVSLRTKQYLRLFRGASNEAYLAEGSTEYTKRPAYDGVAERIHAFNPDARLIYVMRDPFARLVSHYRHMTRKGKEKESLPHAISRPSYYLLFSYYAYQLRPYLQRFGQRSIYLDTFESFVASPVGFCARLFEWLGIDASFVPPSAGERLNVSPEALETYDEHSLRVRLARGLNRYLRYHPRLGRLVTDRARAWYRTLLPKESVRRADSVAFAREVQVARRAVQPLLADWIAELEALTGRSYDEWLSREAGTASDHPLPQPPDVWLPEGVLHAKGNHSDSSR